MKSCRLALLCCGLAILNVLSSGTCICAQTVTPRTAQEQRPVYNIVPYEEDWSFLHDRSQRSDWLDGIKYIPFGHNEKTFVSFGGEFRGTYERLANDNWSNKPVGLNSFGLERFLLHSDVHFGQQARVYLDLQSGLEQGRPLGPRPIDEKKLDFLNAFFDLRPSASGRAPTLRIGKQELQLGSGRLISVREGPNVRQSFYGFRIDQPLQHWKVTGFAVRPAVDRSGYFDGAPQSTTELWGGVGSRTWKRTEPTTINAAYFGLDRKQVTYNRGSAREVRHTLSGNFVLDPPDKSDRLAELHLDIEGMFQFGSFGHQGIRAWSVATETGVALPRLPLSPRVGLRADVASGDRGGNAQLGSFNPLFPAGNYFGVLADTGPGPVNFRDLHPEIILQLPHAVTLTPDWIFWWRQQLEDGVYSISGPLIVPSGLSSARYVGNRPGIDARWQMDRHAYIDFSYGVFFAGPFLKQSGNTKNLNFLAYSFGYKF